jgi:hypothetical protein
MPPAGSPDVRIFPNPVTSGTLNLASEAGLTFARIYTVTGKQVYAQELSGHDAELQTRLPSGTYLVEISIGSQTIRKLLVWE